MKMKVMISAISFLFIATLANSTIGPAIAGELQQQNPPRPGGEVPFPFSDNAKVELADGESYTLVGEVVGSKYAPGLKIDFEEHPWLTSAVRQSNPVYPIIRNGIVWGPWLGKRIIINAQALGQVREVPVRAIAGTNEYRYTVVLKPESDPERF